MGWIADALRHGALIVAARRERKKIIGRRDFDEILLLVRDAKLLAMEGVPDSPAARAGGAAELMARFARTFEDFEGVLVEVSSTGREFDEFAIAIERAIGQMKALILMIESNDRDPQASWYWSTSPHFAGLELPSRASYTGGDEDTVEQGGVPPEDRVFDEESAKQFADGVKEFFLALGPPPPGVRPNVKPDLAPTGHGGNR